MKKIILKSVLFVFILGSMSSCLDNFDELRTNPNSPSSVPPSLIFADLTPRCTASFNGGYERMQYHIDIPVDRTRVPDFTSGFGGSFNYGSLRNVNKMIEEATKTGSQEYIILGKFYKARIYLEMTQRMGDIPFTQAMLGVEYPQPAYDSQKSIYIQCLNWLDEANSELGVFIVTHPTTTLSGDLYFKGNLKQWQKLINVYTLRTLVSLSKKADDVDVNVEGRFAAIINNPAKYPLMNSILDNAEFKYSAQPGFIQDYQPDNAVAKDAIVYASTYIDLLKGKQDPRLMIVADPTKDALNANPNEAVVRADFSSYVGADITATGAEVSSKKLDGDYSFPNEKRYWNFVGQPGVFISYWEQEFCIAEAAHRGWISVSAATHYNNGVTASMVWYGVDPAKISDYLTNKQPYIAGDAGLKRLLEQKYLAFAENSDQESFFTTRRTGVPTYIFSSNNGIDPSLGEKYPVRWTYPGSENNDNQTNYRAALQAQFGAVVDDVDQVIWLLQD